LQGGDFKAIIKKTPYLKKDGNGNVTWESGDNRTLKASNDSQGVKDTELYTWRN
jgi:hypothetical protein